MYYKNVFGTNENPDRELINHLYRIRTIDEYRDWSDQNNFSKKPKKHWKQNKKRNRVQSLTNIYNGHQAESDVSHCHLHQLCVLLRSQKRACQKHPVNKRVLFQLLSHLHQCRAKFFDGSPVIAELGCLPRNTYIEALVLAAIHFRSWLRPVEEWKPQSQCVKRQFASLLRHLFVQYEMPVFFDSIWFWNHTQETAKQIEWYLFVGKGQNIRNCELPIAFTKKMAHHFMHAPKGVSVNKALRWGQVLGLGGDERLARAIFETRLVENFKNEEFWVTVIRWFVAHPMLDRTHVGPIIDFLHAQRFVTEIGHEAPLQPNLTMKGRSPESLLRQVNAWHRRLANDNMQQLREWRPSGIQEFEFLEGSQKNNTLKFWTIRELLSSKSLFAEGRQLKHCVASYAASCAQGYCSIWTMELESCEGFKKLITIEVSKGTNQIRQARGKANRLPNENEKSIICRWAETAGLGMAGYI